MFETAFKTRLVRESDALLHFEVMAWLIRQFGAPARPPVPSPLHKRPALHDYYWDDEDQRAVFDWAQDMMTQIQIQSQCEDWPVQICAAAGPSTHGLDVHPGFEYPHPVDGLGRPVIFYDPRRCGEPGYFISHMVLRLAELRLANFKPETGQSPLMQSLSVLTAAAYARQGLTLANLTIDVSQYITRDEDTANVPLRLIENALCFSTCLALSVRRQAPEQIIATYGVHMPKSFRRKVRLACRQIQGFDAELKLLQTMAEVQAVNLTQHHGGRVLRQRFRA